MMLDLMQSYGSSEARLLLNGDDGVQIFRHGRRVP
jgi:hypothetical protein